ncbi:MAG: hypothetical protein U9N52_11080 [Campylobacterota bacterium]|nr:hypothetical protein [Campylobacterota bacterium]
MQTIQLKVRDDISQTVLNFLNLLPKNSVKIEYPEPNEEEIQAKLKRAKKNLKEGKVYSAQEAREKLLNRLK